MDVFGTVISTIHLVNKIVGYLQAIRSAEENRLKLLSEISALGAILDILHRRLDNTGGNNDCVSNRLMKAGIGGSLDQCYRALRSAAEELERIAPHPNTGKSSSLADKMKNIRWPFQQEEIQSMLAKVERLKSLVSLALQTSLMEFIENTHDELVVVGLNVKRIEATVSALEERQRVHMKKIESREVNLQDLGFTLQESASNIMVIRDTVAMIDRNQQEQVTKGEQIQADLTIIKESVYGQELQDLVKWLSPLDFGEKHSMAFEKCAPNTGEWFLEHPKFLAWKRSMFKTLWCPGDPGVGKSVIASLVIHELGEAMPEDTALAFIYFDYKTEYAMTQLVEVILKQLVRRRITQSNLKSLQKHKAGNRPTSNELLDMLRVEVESYSRVLIVIDALDETDVQIWAPLLEHLQALSGVSLLATSRDTGDVALGLQSDQRLDIMTNEGDMRKYIEGRLLGSTGRFKRLLDANTYLHEEIVTGVIKKADGMFLLARLHMNSLETKAGRVTDLRLALAKLPPRLETTYDETLGRISDEAKPLAYQIFSWLIHAAQPMTIRDLQYALAVGDGMTAIDTHDLYDEATLTSICVGLVVLRGDTAGSGLKKAADPRANDRVVALVHYTTQEYFRRNHNLSAQLADSAHFAVTCLRYLSFDIFGINRPLCHEDSEERVTENPFAKYAMFSWGVHARAHSDDPIVRRLAMKLLHDNQRVVTVGSLPCRTRNLSAIHLCAYFGLRDYLEYLLDTSGFDINSKDSDGDTAVTYAALFGREELVQPLLSRQGVDVAPRGCNGTTPLIRAAMEGHQSVAALLLEHSGVDANCQDNDGRTPIAHAADGGHIGIVELLLARNGLDINSRDEDKNTPFALAVLRGHERIVRLLLARKDLHVNPRSNVGNMPIHHTAWSGHIGILKLLLERDDVDINSQGWGGYSPLVNGILGGHEEIVQLLLGRKDLNVNLRTNSGNTPIILATRKGYEGILKLLLARDDVDVNSRDQHGFTPLASAVLKGHEPIVRLLLARGDSNVNSRSDVGNTPIHHAAWKGHGDILKLLLVRDGVDMNLPGRDGQTPLAAAIFGGHEANVRLLLAQKDLNVNSRSNVGETPIILAARKGHSDIVKILLARDGVDINLQDRGGYTPLTHALLKGHETIVQLLLERDDLDTKLRDVNGNTYLTPAAGDEGAINWFLAKGVDVNSKSLKGQVALGHAARRGHDAVVKLLLAEEGININPVDSDGHTPLDYAEMGKHQSVIELLRAAGGHTAAELKGFVEGVDAEVDEDEREDMLKKDTRPIHQ